MIDREGMKGRGRYTVEHRRDGKVISREVVKNLIVNEGIDHILNTEFCGGQQVSNWYLAPFKNNYQPVSTDKAATLPAAAGESTAYTGGTRQAFTAVEGQQQVSNQASAATFTFNDTQTIYGAFLASAQAQQSTQGVLFSAAQFATPKNVVSGDQLVLTYSLALSSQ